MLLLSEHGKRAAVSCGSMCAPGPGPSPGRLPRRWRRAGSRVGKGTAASGGETPLEAVHG